MTQLSQRFLAVAMLLLSLLLIPFWAYAAPELGEAETNNSSATEVITSSIFADCRQEIATPGGALAKLVEAGFINSPAEMDTICSCASDTILTSLASESSTSAAKAAAQKGMAQCLAPYVGHAVETMCLTARAEGTNTMSVAQCDCFGEQVDLRVTSHPLSFFNHPSNYVKSAGLHCVRTVR